jgi:hypothetical protein
VDIGREEAGRAGEGVARAAARVNGRDVALLVDACDAEDAERDAKARWSAVAAATSRRSAGVRSQGKDMRRAVVA